MPPSPRLPLVLAMVALSQPALAQDEGPVKFDVSGFLDGAVFNADQKSSFTSDRDEIDGLVNGEVHLRGRYLTDDGWELGARVELRLQSGDRSDSTSGADDAFAVDKAFIWAESGLGRLEIGAQDGAAKLFQVEPPSVTKSLRVDHPLMMPVADSTGGYYRPAGLMLRTDPYASDQSLKIVYRSPRLFGLQLGLSYTPEFSANLERFVKRAGEDTDQQSNIWEVGLNYDSTIDDVRLRASLVYLAGANEAEGATMVPPQTPWVGGVTPWQAGDLSEWGAAASVKYQGFTLGAAYRHSNARGGFIDHAPVVLTGGASDTDIWSVGALYEHDSWRFGANYIYGETNVAYGRSVPVGPGSPGGAIPAPTNLVGEIGTQDGQAWQVGAAYVFDSNIQIALGYQRYGFGTDAAMNPSGSSERGLLGLPGVRYTLSETPLGPRLDRARAGAPGMLYVGDLDADILFAEVSFSF